MRPGLQPTDTRLKPDQRNLEDGEDVCDQAGQLHQREAPHRMAPENKAERNLFPARSGKLLLKFFICRWRGVLSVSKDRWTLSKYSEDGEKGRPKSFHFRAAWKTCHHFVCQRN